MRTQRDIVARGDLMATLELECSRCLEPFATQVEIHFEEVYRPSLDVATGAPLKPPDDDALRISEQQVLDLKETVRQYLLTMVPIQPVCQPDCRGLCPNCGAALDTDPCQCDAESRDGPFAALKALFEDGANRRTP
ncbi:MAG: hypothetical protein HW416_1075 [Chloroflexi bacterium]|nr:hypothetical protein [Chloroflexota bacterium]